MNDHGYMNDMNGATATGITLTGFLVGAVFGAGLALLLAPAPGGETRRKVAETARRIGDKASEAVAHGQDALRSAGRHAQEPMAGGRTPGTPA